MKSYRYCTAPFAAACMLLFLGARSQAESSSRPMTSSPTNTWKIPKDAPLLTQWARRVDPARPLPEYPRPQLVRSQWLNLNGLWQFVTEDNAGGSPPVGQELGEHILVPYPIESALSGVMKKAERLWYRKTFEVPQSWKGKRLLLHFGAVDWEATVYMNGTLLGTHRGGYDPFSFDITDALRPAGNQELIVGVYDPTDGGDQPRGKQVRKPHGIWYTPVTGIWQTVWLEPVSPLHVTEVLITPDIDAKCVRVKTMLSDTSRAEQVRVMVTAKRKAVGSEVGVAHEDVALAIPDAHLWSPGDPFLYDLTIQLFQQGKVIDEVKAYFGMRKIALARDERGVNRIMLNGQFLMQVGPLDQGFWPDGIYTAPTDEALRYDIEVTKQLGFNMTRKHVKVEPDRWYYWADKLGLLVWQDMPSAGNTTPEAKRQFERELERLILTHRNHPSIIMWVVFNEGWGQYDTERLASRVKKMDPTRLVNNASGWTDKKAGDVLDIHNYPRPESPALDPDRAIVLGEFGGLGLALPGHTWQKEHWGYRGMKDRTQLTSTYESFLDRVYAFKEVPGLCAAVYTQITDVEVECNGLLTYDRAVIKPDRVRIAAANRGDFSGLSPLPVETAVVPTSARQGQEWRYTLAKPADNWYLPGFNDGAWQKGVGAFGKPPRAGVTLRTSWTTNDIWLRREFSLDSISTRDLVLSVLHDDDAEVFINGIQAATMPGWSPDYEQCDIAPDAKSTLRKGMNLLAVHCHQSRGGQHIDVGIVRSEYPSAKLLASIGSISVRNGVIGSPPSPLYTGNREPLVPAPFMKLPIGSITPKGWLRHMLELEREGMTGRLKEISPWLKFETSAWASPAGEGERGWEEMPYWLKGFGDLGYVLNDAGVIAEARKWIEGILSSQRDDGFFGPRALLTALKGSPDLWPHMVVLNILQSYYEYSADARILPFMKRYFTWQNTLPPEAFGAGYWPKLRMGDNIESVYWLYNRLGEKWLLDLAEKMHKNMARWDEDVINWHNVNVAQGFREPAVYYLQARNANYLNAAGRNYDKVMDMYGQFPGGGFAADENARAGFIDPRQGFETCGIVEFMHSFQMLTRISGNPVWADRCEDIAFNSFPAAMTPDQKGLRYLTCANQIQLDKNNKAPGVQNGGTMMSYSPFQVYRCCQHNVSHGWPYYAEELWLATHDRGLCASLYAASEVKAKVGDGTVVTISEETDYPFDQQVHLTIASPKKVTFPLYLRIPRWCRNLDVAINGQRVGVRLEPGSYIRLERTWTSGDVVHLTLGTAIALKTWEKNKNAVSVACGPLSFALKIDERWSKYGENDLWPEWEVFPTSPWNYGLVVDSIDVTRTLEVVRRPGALPGNPFLHEATPIQIHARARRIPGWQQDYLGLVGLLQQSPARTNEPEEMITLVPMGASRLRIASFPTVTTGPEGHDWAPPAKPRPSPYKVSTSYVNRYDLLEAVSDGLEPDSSNDEKIPRMTWWAHRGTSEWVEYDFSARKISRSAVYWYDDGADGECRVPQSWHLLYKSGETWLPVEVQGVYGVERNAWNAVRFKEVETSGMRLEVQLKEGFSGGILEWKIE